MEEIKDDGKDKWYKELMWKKNQCEAINKENRWQKKFPKGEYSINPFSMSKISDKPNHIVPAIPYKQAKTSDPLDDPVDRAFKLDAMRRKIQTSGMVPRQKYAVPQTSSHEIGWEISPMTVLTQTRSQWNKMRSTSHITQFADEYVRLKAINPFKVKDRT